MPDNPKSFIVPGTSDSQNPTRRGVVEVGNGDKRVSLPNSAGTLATTGDVSDVEVGGLMTYLTSSVEITSASTYQNLLSLNLEANTSYRFETQLMPWAGSVGINVKFDLPAGATVYGSHEWFKPVTGNAPWVLWKEWLGADYIASSSGVAHTYYGWDMSVLDSDYVDLSFKAHGIITVGSTAGTGSIQVLPTTAESEVTYVPSGSYLYLQKNIL